MTHRLVDALPTRSIIADVVGSCIVATALHSKRHSHSCMAERFDRVAAANHVIGNASLILCRWRKNAR